MAGQIIRRGERTWMVRVFLGRDPWTLTAVLIVLGTTGILAGAIPAWRATRVEPSLALRYE